MTNAENIEQMLKRLRIKTSETVDERILADATAMLEHTDPIRPSSLWRTIMISKWTKLAGAAAAVVVAAVLIAATLNGGATVAYALTQTLEANQGLKTIHVKIDPPENGISEAWAQFDADGNLEHVRTHFDMTEIGSTEAVLHANGRAEVWHKDKGMSVVFRDEKTLAKLAEDMQRFDPKRITESLYRKEKAGKVVIETRTSDDSDKPIILIVTPTDRAGWKSIYEIDPVTKLVSQQERYRMIDGEFLLGSRLTFLDYNTPIPPSRFEITLPEGVARIDWTTTDYGLSKGDLTDKEIASKVARAFCDALVAGDYAQLGVLCGGVPTSKMKEYLKPAPGRFVEVISVGEPTPHPNERTRFLVVPCEFATEVEGVRSTEIMKLNIRMLYNQPDRWAVGGGF